MLTNGLNTNNMILFHLHPIKFHCLSNTDIADTVKVAAAVMEHMK
jgi:hypothetical protein